MLSNQKNAHRQPYEVNGFSFRIVGKLKWKNVIENGKRFLFTFRRQLLRKFPWKIKHNNFLFHEKC